MHVKVTANVGKLEDRSQEMIFVGYEQGSKAYRCIDPSTRKLSISKDVIFEELKSLSFSVDNPGNSISYEDFNLDISNLLMKYLKNQTNCLRVIQFWMET